MTEVEFIESLRDAADEAVRPCLRDDLGDIACYMRDGDYEEPLKPIVAAIRAHGRAARLDELRKLASMFDDWTEEAAEPAEYGSYAFAAGHVRDLIAELEAS